MAGDERHLLRKRHPGSSGPELIQAVSACLTSLPMCLATMYIQYHFLLSYTDTRAVARERWRRIEPSR